MNISAIQHVLLILSVIILLSSVVRADEGTSDPDYDYEPPETLTWWGQTQSFVDSYLLKFQPSHATSYSKAKKRLYSHIKDKRTLYCGCSTNLDERTFDKNTCNYVPQKDNKRARRLEAEHILPAFWIAKFHEDSSCWVKNKLCESARDCCLKNDKRFKTAHNDLVNLMPSIGEINAMRRHFTYALIYGEEREFGGCDFEIDTHIKTAEPRDDIRGDIARIYFYMREVYQLVYPEELATLMTEWDSTDKVNQAEIDRNERIKSIQGTSNMFVDNKLGFLDSSDNFE